MKVGGRRSDVVGDRDHAAVRVGRSQRGGRLTQWALVRLAVVRGRAAESNRRVCRLMTVRHDAVLVVLS
jgi:hypothetical protein